MTITVISFDHKLNTLPKYVKNYKSLPKELKDLLNQCDYYMIKGFGQELLFYKGRQCVYSCNTEQHVNDTVSITYVFDKEGLVYSHTNCTEYGMPRIKA